MNKSNEINKLILYSIAFLSGFALMGYEILGVRALSPYYGSSVYVWGAIISVFLAGLSIGYIKGGQIADKIKDLNILRRIFLIPVLIVTTFPVYGNRICKFIYSFELDSRTGALLLSIILFLVPCVFIGMAVPILVKILAAQSHKVGSAAGNVYALSTIGSIAGTLFTSFFMINSVSVSKGFMVMGLLLIACWFLCLVFQRVNTKK
jgi:predicted membrane-bound spermidine synthase